MCARVRPTHTYTHIHVYTYKNMYGMCQKVIAIPFAYRFYDEFRVDFYCNKSFIVKILFVI